MMMNRRQSAGYMTNRAARLFALAIDRQLAAIDVSSGQLPVFFALGNGEALPQKQLTRDASIQQPTMAATLSRMERDGLVVTRPDPADGRSTLYSLTPKAMEKSKQVMAAVQATNGLALAGLEPGERDAYLENLGKIIGALEAFLEDRR